MASMGSLGRKRVYSLSQDQLLRKRQKKEQEQLQQQQQQQHTKAVACTTAVVVADYHTERIRSFREMCQRHEGTSVRVFGAAPLPGRLRSSRSPATTCHINSGFITTSSAIDGYLLALASLYLKRAGLSAQGYKKDRYFFYALYLAIGTLSLFALMREGVSTRHRALYRVRAETEEDLPRGAEEILLYLLGPAPSGLLGRRTLQIEWDRRLSNFLTGKDKVQRMLETVAG
jgi:hypothetical protein